jgi:hypothetical protein
VDEFPEFAAIGADAPTVTLGRMRTAQVPVCRGACTSLLYPDGMDIDVFHDWKGALVVR